jgi:AcrR family transcriptional regulator
VDGVAVNEITEAADVGYGSFYNHFESKDAIHAAVFAAIFDDFGDALDRLTADQDDPAAVIAICVRQTIAHAKREPLWGRFLLREWYRPEALSRGLGARLLRDIQQGIARKRFVVTDVLMSGLVAGAAVIGAIAALLGSGEGTTLLEPPVSVDDLDRRAAAALLHGLGLTAKEARAIAERPLPAFAWVPRFGS